MVFNPELLLSPHASGQGPHAGEMRGRQFTLSAPVSPLPATGLAGPSVAVSHFVQELREEQEQACSQPRDYSEYQIVSANGTVATRGQRGQRGHSQHSKMISEVPKLESNALNHRF